MKKKIVLAIILIFSFSLLFGFKTKEVKISNDFILLSLENSANGMIRQSVRFGMNSSQINHMALNLKEELDFKRNLTGEIKKLRNEFLLSFALVYIDNPIDIYKINKGVICTPVEINEENDFIGFDVVFTSIDAWNYYQKIESKNDDKKGGNIFYNKISSVGQFPFSAKTSDNLTLGEIYKRHYLIASQGLSFEEKLKESYHPQYIYNYSTFYKKIKSNANLKYYSGNSYHHIWLAEENELESAKNIKISLTQVNKGYWILFGLGVPLLSCITAIVIIKLKKRPKK